MKTNNSQYAEARVSVTSVESPYMKRGDSPPLNKLIEGLNNSRTSNEQFEVNLEELWRFGIPVNIRKVLWPFKIENKLGLS